MNQRNEFILWAAAVAVVLAILTAGPWAAWRFLGLPDIFSVCLFAIEFMATLIITVEKIFGGPHG